MIDCSNILVTGGCGFIGSYVVNELVKKGFNVIVLDSLQYGKIENVKACLGKPNFKLIKGDIRSPKIVKRSIKGVDAIIHLAAIIDVEKSVSDPMATHDVNVNGTLILLKESVSHSIRKFVFASSCAVYGEGNPLPFREEYPLRPVSPYAVSKAAAEYYCSTFYKNYNLPTVMLRYFNVYGPKQVSGSDGNVIKKFLDNALNKKPLKIFGNGNQTRDFVYVEDVVNATLLALWNDNAVGETFNICTGKPTSINELVGTLQNTIGKNLLVRHEKPRKGDIYHSYGDPSKAERMLGFKAKIDLNEGLKILLYRRRVS